MASLKQTALSPQQIERRNRILAKGRGHYIFYRGVLGWGLNVFLVTTLWDWLAKYGWHLPSDQNGLLWLFTEALVRLGLWLAGGYVFGAIMWRQSFQKPS